jgi:hypothetical protein
MAFFTSCNVVRQHKVKTNNGFIAKTVVTNEIIQTSPQRLLTPHRRKRRKVQEANKQVNLHAAEDAY